MGKNKLVHSYDKKENHEWKKWSVTHLLNNTEIKTITEN